MASAPAPASTPTHNYFPSIALYFGASAAAGAAAWGIMHVALSELAWHSAEAGTASRAIAAAVAISAVLLFIWEFTRAREIATTSESRQRFFDAPTRAAAWMIFAGGISLTLLFVLRFSETLRAWVISNVLLPEFIRIELLFLPPLVCVGLIAFASMAALQRHISNDMLRTEVTSKLTALMPMLPVAMGALVGVVIGELLGVRRAAPLLAAMGFFLAGVLLATQPKKLRAAPTPRSAGSNPGQFRDIGIVLIFGAYFAYWLVSAFLELGRDVSTPDGIVRQLLPFLAAISGLLFYVVVLPALRAGPMLTLCLLLPIATASVPTKSVQEGVAAAKLFVIVAASCAGIACVQPRSRVNIRAKILLLAAAIGALFAVLAPISIFAYADERRDAPEAESAIAAALGRESHIVNVAGIGNLNDALQVDVFGSRFETICIETLPTDAALSRDAAERLLERCRSALKQQGRLLIRLPASGFPGPMFRMKDAQAEPDMGCYVLYGTVSWESRPICYLVSGRDIEAWTMRMFSRSGSMQLFPVASKAQLALVLGNLAVQTTGSIGGVSD